MNKSKKFFCCKRKQLGSPMGIQDSAFVSKGDKTVSLSGNRYNICSKNLPGLIPFAEEVLDIKVYPTLKLKRLRKVYIKTKNKQTIYG